MAVLGARLDLKGFCTGTYPPVIQILVSPSNGRRFVSSSVSCCCKDTRLSSGMHLG